MKKKKILAKRWGARVKGAGPKAGLARRPGGPKAGWPVGRCGPKAGLPGGVLRPRDFELTRPRTLIPAGCAHTDSCQSESAHR